MEPRKVQKVGYSTLSISLPTDWVKKTGIQKGDLVFISEEKDRSLKLTVEPAKSEEQNVYIVNVDRCDNVKILERIIVANYVLGRNIIKVESSRRLMREEIESIRNVAQRLLGLGIIEESDYHLILQCSIDPKSFPLPTVLRRLYMITSIMFKETVDAIIDDDVELAKDALIREPEADTIYWLLTRLLASAQESNAVADEIGVKEPLILIQKNIIAVFLEMIGDRILQIANKIIELNDKKIRNNALMDRLSQIGLMTLTMFDKAINSVFEGDVKVASDVVDMRDLVEKEENNLERYFHGKADIESVSIINSIVWNLKHISELSAAIAEIAIDKVLMDNNEMCSIMKN
ncbi:phosphate uptake regulator PhoU [Candidatus Bathyarchaeota archaeon]|nr:phosphate uptake regulator PhoU [Candidatus Bathyarchaeota archaeon]